LTERNDEEASTRTNGIDQYVRPMDSPPQIWSDRTCEHLAGTTVIAERRISHGEDNMTEIESVQYTGKTHTSGGRDGSAHSNDGRLDVRLTVLGAIGTGAMGRE